MEFLTVDEIARMLKASREFVCKNRRLLGGIKVGRLVRFPKTVFERIIEEVHRSKWRYDFLKGGVHYKRAGFKTKAEAVQAEAGAGIQSINTDFLKLCTARLEDIEIRRSKHHFSENKKLFEILMQL
mgnify:CR=1 FL=1